MQTSTTHNSVEMTVGLVGVWIVVMLFVAHAVWKHYHARKRGGKAQHSNMPEEIGAVSLAPQVVETSSIRGWLDTTVKSGYGNKFTTAFEQVGIDDVGDLAKVDKNVMAELNENLLATGAKAMHLKNIQDAIDGVRTPGAADAVELGLSGGDARYGDQGDQGHGEAKEKEEEKLYTMQSRSPSGGLARQTSRLKPAAKATKKQARSHSYTPTEAQGEWSDSRNTKPKRARYPTSERLWMRTRTHTNKHRATPHLRRLGHSTAGGRCGDVGAGATAPARGVP